MANNVKYSIIIPVYNREKTLSRCLDSLLVYPREDVQIIVVDDGSKDRSGRIAREYAARYSTVEYLYKNNGGVSSARNLGLDCAVGEFILFVDSDDHVTEDYFAVLDCWSVNPCHDMLVFQKSGFGGESLDETCWFEELVKLQTSFERLEYLTATRLIMHPVNKCLKNEIIQREHLRFAEDLHIGEDFVFCMAYALYCRGIDIEQSNLYRYDVSDQGSLSRKYRKDLCGQMNHVYARVRDYIAVCALPLDQKNRLMAVADYLYIKNVCSCIAEEFKHGHFGYLRYREDFAAICGAFQRSLSDQRCNLIHRGLRLLLKWHIYWPFYGVTYLAKGRKLKKTG